MDLEAIKARCALVSESRTGDADFIEHAWEDVPALVAQVELLRDVADAADRVLRKFGDDYEVRFSELRAALAAAGYPE